MVVCIIWAEIIITIIMYFDENRFQSLKNLMEKEKIYFWYKSVSPI